MLTVDCIQIIGCKYDAATRNEGHSKCYKNRKERQGRLAYMSIYYKKPVKVTHSHSTGVTFAGV